MNRYHIMDDAGNEATIQAVCLNDAISKAHQIIKIIHTDDITRHSIVMPAKVSLLDVQPHTKSHKFDFSISNHIKTDLAGNDMTTEFLVIIHPHIPCRDMETHNWKNDITRKIIQSLDTDADTPDSYEDVCKECNLGMCVGLSEYHTIPTLNHNLTHMISFHYISISLWIVVFLRCGDWMERYAGRLTPAPSDRAFLR